jgi:sodium-dependent dicarboxylate transporter 2/3/5
MFLKSKQVQLVIALLLGAAVMLLPRPEGKIFKITGPGSQTLLRQLGAHFKPLPPKPGSAANAAFEVEAQNPGSPEATADFIRQAAAGLKLEEVQVHYVDGLSPKAKRLLAIMAVLIFLFIFEPIPLEATALCIGILLVVTGVGDFKSVWAAYMHPVVVFIMSCLIFAVSLDKAGLTTRMGYFIIRKSGNSITRFTFILTIGLGTASMFMHDAAACAIGIVTMLPMMRAAGIEPHTRTARFMMLSLPFAASCGGMGSLIGGGRCMVAAAFLKEFTGLEISFFDWMKYAMPAALLCVPLAVGVVYLVYRPDPNIKLPRFEKTLGPWSALEKKTLAVTLLTFVLWLTKGFHGIDYSVTGMFGVVLLIICGVLKWSDIHENMEWGTALFIFGGGISLGLAMDYSGAAAFFANLFFPLIRGSGWLMLYLGVGVFGALVTNVMANVAAAALILPIVIPMAQMEGVNPTILALCLGQATSFAMLLVIGCPPNAISYSYHYFKASDLTRAGAVATPVLLAALVLVAAVWWKILGLV